MAGGSEQTLVPARTLASPVLGTASGSAPSLPGDMLARGRARLGKVLILFVVLNAAGLLLAIGNRLSPTIFGTEAGANLGIALHVVSSFRY